MSERPSESDDPNLEEEGMSERPSESDDPNLEEEGRPERMPERPSRSDDTTVDPRTLRFLGLPGDADHADTPGARGLSAEDQATIEALRPGTALLVVLRGPNSGARFLLDEDQVLAGRHPDSDIFLDDVTVSRRHAVFSKTGEGYRVRDAGSLNGTYVNRRLVDEVVLQTGDEVQVGKFRLVYYAA